jgi:hypothetical protein
MATTQNPGSTATFEGHIVTIVRVHDISGKFLYTVQMPDGKIRVAVKL